MSESGSLSSVVKGITKFDGKAEYFEDWREQLYVNVSSARGYEHVKRILNGERRPEPVTLQQLHLQEEQRLQVARPPAQPQGTPASTTSPRITDASSRTHRSGRTTGNQETNIAPPVQDGGGSPASTTEQDTSILERLRQEAINEQRV